MKRLFLLIAGFFLFALTPVYASVPISAHVTDFGAYPVPIFLPADEARLQAILGVESLAPDDDKRLFLLPDIAVRSALEDTRRLHYSLG